MRWCGAHTGYTERLDNILIKTEGKKVDKYFFYAHSTVQDISERENIREGRKQIERRKDIEY